MSRLRKKQSSAGKSPLVATNIDQAYLLYMTMHDNKAPTASRFKKFINDDKRCQMPEIDFVTADHYLTSTGKGRTSASPSGTTYAHVMPKKKKRKKRKHDRSRTTSISASTSADPKKKRKKNKHYRQTNFDFTQESISNKSRPEVQLASLSEFSSLKPSKAKKHSRGKKTKRRGKRGLPRNHYRLQISTMLLIIFSSISLISAQNSSSYFDCSTQCNYDMYCVDGADCTVKCSADNSCRYGAIHPPNVGNLTVTCGPLKNTCRYMTLRGPMNGSFDLSCANVKSCENVDAICPIFGDCTVEIVSSHYDHAMTVNATNMISGGLYIAEIQRSTVQCPGNYLQCVINCTAAPCKSTSFHTKEDSILRIFASGASSLQSARVYSTLNTNYSIVVTDPVSDALSHFRLYSTDAMKDVIDKRLICDYVHNVSECYDYKNPPQLWCGSQYDAGCAMVNKGNNSWDCQNMTVSELCTSNETLSGYYGSQIVCSDSSECDYNMRCIDGEDCTVTCSGPHSCRYGALHPPNVGNLTVTCGPNKYSCHGTTLRAPMNGSFTLSCGGWVSCNYVYAFCPIFGDCTVEIVSSHYDHIMTVNASSMISGGLYIVEIQRSTVLCPGNYLECIANCTAAPCKSTSFYTQRDSSLSIFASGASSLQNANVYCALYANCSIIITQPVSDVLLHFKLYSIDAMNQRLICDYAHNVSECYDYKDPPQLWCGSQYDTGCAMVNTGNNSWGCENMTFSELCTNNETLRGYYGSHILCKDGGECNYDMRCIDGEDCTVTCSGAGSCGSGTIHGPNAGNLTVTCGGGEYACHAMTLRGQMNGSLALSCAGHNTCGSVYAMCPIYGDCTVEVTYFHHTNPLTVDATNMTYGGLHVIELQSGTVKCPGNYLECVADCIAVPCTGTSFHTKEDSILRIFASGASSLQNVEVYSALNTNYSIVVTDPVSDALSHFKLYSADAMKDVIDKRLICDYAHNVSECYDDKDPPQLWCGSQYDTGCAMVNKGNNSWDCQNMTVSELCTSNETLSGYYGSQIVCSKQGECNSVDLYCIDGEYCAVTCSASGSCGGATIHPPNVGNLSVTCGPSEHSCRDLILKRPMNGSFTLSCAGHGSCFNVDAICPVFGDCTVEVTYFHHTNPVTVDATHMTYGKLQVIELQSGTVHCPGNYLECVADCIAVPCTGTSFHTKNGSILTILSSGISSLQSVNIYCALNANCSITVDCGAQRSVVCDIESNTGPSYNEWRCNVPDSSHSINFTDLCVTADPTTNPSADPIIKPTADPTDTKLNTGTETSITITCGGSDCHFDEETAKVITNILIAYLDEDVQIIGTTITSNKVIIAIANADWDSLERDTISRDIKNELEDVDVSFDDAEDDEEIEHIKPNSDIFGDILEFLTSNIILGIIIGLALFLIIMAVGCVCWLLKKRKRAKIHQNMMTIPGVNVTDADIVPGATTQAKMHHLNMMEMPGTTTQADTVTPPIVPPLPPPTTRDYDEESINDKDTDDEADELYDVVFEDTKGGNTKDGNTKGGNTKGAITAM